jgi:iron(III) transport system permease protein
MRQGVLEEVEEMVTSQTEATTPQHSDRGAARRGGTTSGLRRRLQALRDWMTVERVIVGGLIIFLTWEVVVPFIALIFASLKNVRPDDDTFLNLDLTLDNWREVLASEHFWQASWTTVIFAVGASIFATVIGIGFAFVTTRTNAPWRGLIASLALYQLAIPDALYPISWGFLANPDLGLFNQLWRDLTGSDTAIFDIYSMPAMILVQGFLLAPIVYLFGVTAMTSMNRSLEEAAETCGATHRYVLKDIILKLAAPAIAATFILALMRSWEAFEVPWFLGIRTQTITYSTELFFRSTTPPSNTGLISSFALPMLLMALAMMWWYHRFNRRARMYAVLAGKSQKSDVIILGPVARRAVSAVSLFVLAVGVVLPTLMLIWTSLQPFYRPPSLATLETVSLDSYQRVFETLAILHGFKNSLLVGLASTALVLVVVSFTSWFVVRGQVRGRRLLDLFTFVPMSFPNILVGICLLWIFLSAPGELTGSYLAIILAYFIIFVSISARLVTTRMYQIHGELYEAAVMSGASFLTAFRTVILPLLIPALLTSGLFITAWAFKELETAALLSNPDTQTTMVVVYNLSRTGTFSEVAAVGTVALIGLVLVISAFQIIGRRFGIRGF